MSKLEKVIIVIASLAALTAAFMIFKTARDYKAASDEYDSLRQYASEEVNATETAEKVSDIKPIELEEAEERKELKSNENREDFPEMEVDFKALREKNPDTVGWLYVGSCGISYPIVQGEDNDYYMNHTFEGTVNSSGAIIMDYRDDKYLKDWNTFIYGHNMKNGSMFG